MRSRKRIILVLVVGLLTVLTFYAISLLKIVGRIKEFRKLPQRSIAERYFTGNDFQDNFACALIFRPGVHSYECTIRSWAYNPNKISNTLWNRWTLENDVSRMTLEERVEHLPKYPFDPTGILRYLKETLYGAPEGYKILLVLAKAEGSNSIYQDWIEKRIILPHDSELFLKCIKYLVQLPDADVGKLFEMFITELNKVTEEDLTKDDFGRLGYYYYMDKYFAEENLWEHCQSDIYIFYTISKFLKLGTNTSASLLEWMDRSLSTNKLELTASVAKVIGLYTFSTNSQEAQIAQAILMRELGKLNPCEVGFLSYSLPHKRLFSEAQSSFPQVAIEFFHRIAHENLVEAEAIAQPILAGPDSELRKGIIVILIRHGSSVGASYLDDAFRGNARRRTLFAHIGQYTYGSKVVEQYSNISHHEYTGIPKAWPPSNIDGSTWQEEVIQWRNFIDEIPWFPGTDDAYYRMGYLQYAFGDLEGAVQTVREFASRDFPEYDARRYVAHLLRNLSFKAISLRKNFPELEHIYDIQQLGILMFEQHPKIQNVTNAINWLLNNQNFQSLLNLDAKILGEMLQIANDIGGSSLDERFELLIRQHDDIWGSNNYWNSSSEQTFSKIFYSLSNPPEYPQNLELEKESIDFNYKLIKDVSVRLKYECENSNSQNEKRDRILWALIHYYLMPYNYRDNFAFAIDLAKLLDRQNFPPNLDWMYERIHRGY